MNVTMTAAPDGSLIIAPVSPEQVTAIAEAMGVSGPDDAPSYDGRFVLTVPPALADRAKVAIKSLGKKG